jgi:hypothetical protein
MQIYIGNFKNKKSFRSFFVKKRLNARFSLSCYYFLQKRVRFIPYFYFYKKKLDFEYNGLQKRISRLPKRAYRS